MKLSILICSLKDRKSLLINLMNYLTSQPGFYNYDTEILVEVDSGEMSTGAKRNKLLERAAGDYICFIDDDDVVSIDYIEKILRAIETKPDCCSLIGEISFSRRRRKKEWIPAHKKIFKHSIKYSQWFEKDGIYYRCPNHLNVVKRELALQVRFPEVDVGEDKDYSMRLLPLLKTEGLIEGIIYFYRT